ncbi:hypothetical protein CC80DRAFT_116438 [Byssothecium circinans]|uniref:Uncharacterized protein n=1 Tax=Byssothecium circinans TaxID=147558 RepID=A0A6A5TQ52_9PLEO|nr:hypothetical protein CC80DRAFT_116438 [Byssothecium circinans]
MLYVMVCLSNWLVCIQVSVFECLYLYLSVCVQVSIVVPRMGVKRERECVCMCVVCCVDYLTHVLDLNFEGISRIFAATPPFLLSFFPSFLAFFHRLFSVYVIIQAA